MTKTFTQIAEENITAFEKRYDYDASYLKAILHASPDAMQAYQGFTKMGEFRKTLSSEAYFVANIATTQSEDCGSCLQLVVKMAKEAGVSDEIVRGALQQENDLPNDLKILRQFAAAVATNSLTDGLLESVRDHYNEEELAEIALCIAANRVYPTLKRALGFAGESCELIDLNA